MKHDPTSAPRPDIESGIRSATAISLERGLSVTIHFGTQRDAGLMFDALKDLFYGYESGSGPGAVRDPSHHRSLSDNQDET